MKPKGVTSTIYVVGYETAVRLITTDKAEAEKFCEAEKKKHPILSWGVRTIKEAVEHAWECGHKEGSLPEDY